MPAHAPLAQAKPQTAKPARRAAARAGTPLEQLQTKLQVGAVGDHYEREANRVAAQVMGGGAAPTPAIPPTISPLGAQRKTQPKPEEEARTSKPAARVQRDVAAGAAASPASVGPAGGSTTPAVADSIAALRSGSAAGLDGGTRSFMESRFGRDFTGVRVHDGPAAAAAASALGARAFTVGHDIFFNAGEYQPQTRSGRELLAHELTHTVQQGGEGRVAARQLVQRAGDDETDSPNPPSVIGAVPSDTTAAPAPATRFAVPGFSGASVDTTDVGTARGTITLPVLGLPQIAEALKGAAGGKNTPVAASGRAVPALGQSFTIEPPAPVRKETVAAAVWTEAAKDSFAADLKGKLGDKLAAATAPASIENTAGDDVYYLTFKSAPSARENLFIGTLEQLAGSDALLRPQWSPNGRVLTALDERLDADHWLEAQLGGADDAANMWLLQASYNRSVGSKIGNAIRNDLRRVIGKVPGIPEGQEPGDETAVDAHWAVRFSNVARGADFGRATQVYWTRNQISQGEHLEHLRFMTEEDLVTANLQLEPGHRPKALDVYPSAQGGRRTRFTLNGQSLEPPPHFYYGLIVNSATYEGDGNLGDPNAPLMSLNLTAFRTRKGKTFLSEKTADVTVTRTPQLGIAGFVAPAAIRQRFSKTDFPGLSPVEFSDMGVSADGMLTAQGHIAATRLLFPGLQVPLALEGERAIIRFPLPLDALSFGPLSVTEATLGLGAGPDGVFLEGQAGIAVATLGQGTLGAQISEAGPVLTGQFNLAMDFLDPASFNFSYNLSTDELTGQAPLGVQEGRIPGVESGTVTVGFTRESISVIGTLNLGGPLRGTAVSVTYTPTDGLRIGADNIPLPLTHLPAVQNATLSIAASRPPGAEAWSLSGSGSATLAAPGATGTLDISYRDGALLLHGVGTVERGPASGTLDFTATNRPIDELGQPVDGPLVDGINAWGRGTVTVRFGNVLTGTAGIEYTPDNRVILSGTIAMPPVYDVFPRRDFNRDIFTLSPPEFPIWGVSLGGVGVGIFAFVDARVFFESHVGPGQIRNAAVTATLDLDRPEDATVHGEGEFYVPAYAGLGLDVGGGLRARLAVAYAEGRVGLIGRLGVEAGAGAAVTFDWNRSDGLSLGVDLHAEATPKFELSATASVTVGVDLLVSEIEKTWGPWERELGSFGPDMTLGVRLPVRWTEAGGLDLSLDNIEVTRPNLDAPALMTSVFEQLAP